MITEFVQKKIALTVKPNRKRLFDGMPNFVKPCGLANA
jgi:hypothetical protein